MEEVDFEIENWWQEDERKKREKEERIAREEEFLRSSLRGSRKLQALENSPPTTLRPSVTGVVNIAYSTGEEADDVDQESPPEAALTNAGLALALARNNYLINAGPMQKVVGNPAKKKKTPHPQLNSFH